MAYSRTVALLLLCLSAAVDKSNTATTATDGGKCTLVTTSSFSQTVTYSYNGQQYTATETFSGIRGSACKTSTTQSQLQSCATSYHVEHDLYSENGDSTSSVGGLTARMCTPKQETTVVNERTVYPGGGTDPVVLKFRWSNITDCSCRVVWTDP